MGKKGGKKGGGKAKAAKKATKVGRSRGQMMAGMEGVGAAGPRGRRGRRARNREHLQSEMRKAQEEEQNAAAEQKKKEEKMRKAMGSQDVLDKTAGESKEGKGGRGGGGWRNRQPFRPSGRRKVGDIGFLVEEILSKQIVTQLNPLQLDFEHQAKALSSKSSGIHSVKHFQPTFLFLTNAFLEHKIPLGF